MNEAKDPKSVVKKLRKQERQIKRDLQFIYRATAEWESKLSAIEKQLKVFEKQLEATDEKG